MNPLFKHLRTICATLLLGLLCATGARAQNPDLCKPDCDSSEFGATLTKVIEIPGGCTVLVKYAVRNACNIYYDVGIISIQKLEGCGGIDVVSGVEAATIALLQENPMGFPLPDTGQCLTSWRVVRGACWKDSIDFCDNTLWAPCYGEACCLAPYRICRDSSGTLSVNKTGSITYGECDTLDLQCHPICGEEPGASSGPGPSLSHSSHRACIGALKPTTRGKAHPRRKDL